MWCILSRLSPSVMIEKVHDIVDMKKFSAKRVLSKIIKTCVITSEECLAMLKRSWNDFWRQFIAVIKLEYITAHERTIYTEGFLKWICDREYWGGLLAHKFMSMVFWDVRGLIKVAHLEKSKTIIEEYYVVLLNGFN